MSLEDKKKVTFAALVGVLAAEGVVQRGEGGVEEENARQTQHFLVQSLLGVDWTGFPQHLREFGGFRAMKGTRKGRF